MTFEERIAGRYAEMSPAEQRVAQFFRTHPEEVLIASAAALAAKAKTSDATIVRTARTLGYPGLDALRRDVAREMRHSLSPAERLSRTLDEVGDSPAAAFRATIETHLQCLQSLASSVIPAQFESAIKAITDAKRVVVFGIGPSSTIANYLVIQLGRFGIDAFALSNTGLLFADDLGRLRGGDLVVMLAYSRVYPELNVLLGAADALHLQTILITDSLASALRRRVGTVLSVPRGRSDMLSMHTATLGFLEGLLVGIATQRPEDTLASLRRLNRARTKLAGRNSQLHPKT